MDAASPQPTTDPAESLVRIVQGLCEAIATGCEEQLPASPMKRLVLTQLRRLTAWFAALIADFHAGLLPAGPQANRPGPEIPASARTLARPPHLLRRGFGWLLRLVPGTAAFDKQVQHWLFGPEMGGTARAVAANSSSQPALPEAGDPAAPALRSSLRRRLTSPAATPDSGPAAALASSASPVLLPAASPLFLQVARPWNRDLIDPRIKSGDIRWDPSPPQPPVVVAVRSLFTTAAQSLAGLFLSKA
jgi:hypothetical protein